MLKFLLISLAGTSLAGKVSKSVTPVCPSIRVFVCFFPVLLARDVIYIHLALRPMLRCQYPSVCPSVCDGSALWSRCMPGRGEGSSRAMLATARPSCTIYYISQLPYTENTTVMVSSQALPHTGSVLCRSACHGTD